MRDFTNERLTVGSDRRTLVGSAGRGVVYVEPDFEWNGFATTREEADALTFLLADSFNACRDALSVLERGEGLTDGYGLSRAIDARAILRRAIYGEG